MPRRQARDFDTVQDALDLAGALGSSKSFGATHVLDNHLEKMPKVYSPSGGSYIERELYSAKGRYHWPRQGVRVKKLPAAAKPLVPSFGEARENPVRFYRTEAKRVGDRLGVDWRKVSLDQFTIGMKEEQEHKDVTRGDPMLTGKIVLAHLKEDRDYYTKLKGAGLEAEEARRGPACGPDVRKAGWVHRGGCHPARPLCRMARREKGLCYCTAYSYPHREGSGMCVQGPEGSARFERHVHGPERQYEPEPEPIPEDESFGAWVRRNPARPRRSRGVERLEGWYTTKDYGDPYEAPERKAPLVVGVRSSDGEKIITSQIVQAKGNRITTKTGSVYELGKPDRGFLEHLKKIGHKFDPKRPIVLHTSPLNGARECSCGVKENPVDENGIPWVKVERDPKIQEELVEIQDGFGPIAGSKDVYRLLSPWAVKQEQEHLLVVMTDIHSEIKGVALIHKGERDRVSVSPSDVLRPAIERSAAGLVLVHNHPSGRADHSKADADLTKAIREACDAANITFMDHVVLGTGEFYSFADKKLHKVKK